MTSCRSWLDIAILRRSEETCQAREFIVLSVEQKSVLGQIVCGHLPVQKIAWVPACAAECGHMEHVHITWKGKPWRTTSTSIKWTKVRKVGVEEWPSRTKGGGIRSILAHVRKEWSRDDRDPALTSAEHDGDPHRSGKTHGEGMHRSVVAESLLLASIPMEP